LTPFWPKYVDTGSGPGRGRPKKGSKYGPKRGQKGVQNRPILSPILSPFLGPSRRPLGQYPITRRSNGGPFGQEGSKRGSKYGPKSGQNTPILTPFWALFWAKMGPFWGPFLGHILVTIGYIWAQNRGQNRVQIWPKKRAILRPYLDRPLPLVAKRESAFYPSLR
jgi:hypothetical protein